MKTHGSPLSAILFVTTWVNDVTFDGMAWPHAATEVSYNAPGTDAWMCLRNELVGNNNDIDIENRKVRFPRVPPLKYKYSLLNFFLYRIHPYPNSTDSPWYECVSG